MAPTCPPGCTCGRHAHVLRTSYDKECVECGALFTAKRIDAKYCSGTCSRRAYARNNRDKVRETSKRWQRENRAAVKEIQRRHRDAHTEDDQAKARDRYAEISADDELAAARRAKAHEYYVENREILAVKAKARRARDRNAGRRSEHGTEWEPLFNAFWEAQDGKCYLCGDPLQPDLPKAIHLDHDHACCPLGKSCERCRRGLACVECNHLIAKARDDPDRLRRIADNLERANEGVRERMQQPRQIPATKLYELTCEFCGMTFQGGRRDIKCCSSSCYGKLRYREREVALADGDGTVPCKQCGEIFLPRTVQNVYCTKRCANKARNPSREDPVDR